MINSLTEAGLARFVTRQVNHLFPDDHPITEDMVREVLPATMARVEHCFAAIENRYFCSGHDVVFNHLHGDQYAMFLYLASNTAFRIGRVDDLPAKLFLLNKCLHGIDAYFEVELPSIFLFVHPLGTVLGRAKYGDYFIAYQRCSVGSNHDVYPQLGEHVTLHPGSSVLGRCRVGSDCALAADSLLLDADLADNMVYFGRPGAFKTRRARERAKIWKLVERRDPVESLLP